MRRYDNYIETNVQWLGKQPINWKIVRGKDLFFEKSKKGYPNLPLLAASQKQGVVLKEMLESRSMEALKDFENFKKVDISDFVISLRSFQGGIETAYYNGIISPAYTVFNFRTKNNFTRFFTHIFKSVNFIKFLQNSITGIRDGQSIKFKEIQNTFFALPSFHEQQAIANFLDAKTQAIDKKVSLLEQKIETYKKLKNTIIAKAVTQGIVYQELSINDLGFKTPENWTKCRLKDLGKLYSGLSGKSGDDFNQDDNPNNRGFIPFTNIANNTYLKKDHLGTVAIGPGERQNKVRKGDLFFLMSSEGYGDIGKTAVLADDIDEAYLNSFCKGYRINQNKCNPYFLNYLLLSNIYRQRLLVEGKGFTRINLKMEKVTDFEIFIPSSVSEQEEIATYLDQKTAIIDAIIGNVGRQMETLQQLRKTLINDVVTGKIMVAEQNNYALTN